MVDSAYFLAPPVVNVRFEVAPAFNAFQSLRALIEVNRLSGLGEWVTQTTANLPPERRDLTEIFYQTFETLFYEYIPVSRSETDFLGYVDTIAACDPYQMRDAMLALYAKWPQHHPNLWSPERGELTPERLLSEEDTFVSFLKASCEHSALPNPTLLHRSFELYQNPPQMQAIIVEHLRWLWNEALADEWRRVQPMLEESVAAFRRMDFSNVTALEATRIVTTRDLSGMLEHKTEIIDTVVFVPSAHIGPYVTISTLETTLYVIFGARLPRNAQIVSSALSRSELLTRLNALGDDTRLRILELLTQNEELCAQDIIERLDLSQSSISRHLSQLSANGFITERRREVAKCYSLNTDRVMDTLRTLTNYLSRQ
ncbi:MAG: metalloregulator ArsR/SmtB family transcription factor [Chloroflexota bacterium]